MKRLIICFFAFSVSFSVFCQTHISEGDACFERGDYACAVAKYKAAFESAKGKDRQIADLKRGKAENCQQWIKNANQAFASKEYATAKTEYQKVLESNPKDEYATKQIEKCNNASKPLRKATTAELTDIWNNKYGILPGRRQNLIDAGIDPDDAQRRINNGEGKPVTETAKPTTTSKQATTLSTSTTNVSFNVIGGTQRIYITTNASSYTVSYLPSWCSVSSKTATYFEITCKANHGSPNRNDWFKVSAGDKEVRIVVQQLEDTANQSSVKTNQPANLSVSKESIYFNTKGGKSEQIKIYSNAETYNVSASPYWCTVQTNNGYIVVTCDANTSKTYRQGYFTVTSGNDSKRIYVTQGGKNDCFNCPKTKDTWGLTLGYTNYDYAEGVLLGLKAEPLFKYGFGLNTGINLEACSYKNYYSDDYYSGEFDRFAINIPLHLEYRFNFSKWFNIFCYGGLGFNAVTNVSFDDYSLPVTFEYGGGLRISHIQFNIGRSTYIGDFRDMEYFGQYNQIYQNYTGSISYMF
jgi:tetratricopeptide (TPR) repeat protein